MGFLTGQRSWGHESLEDIGDECPSSSRGSPSGKRSKKDKFQVETQDKKYVPERGPDFLSFLK